MNNSNNHDPEPEANLNSEIELETSPNEGSCDGGPGEESLFEDYEPRSTESIVAQQQLMQESHAAEAAAIILDGVEPPEFAFPDDTTALPLPNQEHHGVYPHAHGHRIRVQRVSPIGHLFTPGAQFVYALIIISLLGGLIGLAATIESPVLVLAAGIASPILLPICAWKWVRWLDSTPYYYRLLTSLGEDARNLLHYRLLWKRSG